MSTLQEQNYEANYESPSYSKWAARLSDNQASARGDSAHVAVFESDIHDPSSDIVVLVERHAPIEESQVDQLLVAMPKEAFPINRILLARSREIPRTTSGKKRHFYCRKIYQNQEIKFQQAIEVSTQRIVQAQNKATNS